MDLVMDIFSDVDDLTEKMVAEGYGVKNAGKKLLRILMLNGIPDYKGHTERALGKYYREYWRRFVKNEAGSPENAIEQLIEEL